MTTLTWKILPVFTLTVRQFTGGKAVRVVAGLSAIPIVFVLIYLINPDIETARDFVVDVIYRGIVVATLLPIAVLILATGALGNEVEDKTIPYLILKPIGRFRIVVEKFIGVLIVAAPIILAGLAITYGIAYRGDAGDDLRILRAMLVATAVGVAVYGAIFLFISLLISRALLAGIVYSIVWESLLGRFIPGLKLVSVRHFVESIFVRLSDDPDIELDKALQLGAALITIAVLVAISLLLATWRLRRMNID